MPGIPPYIGRFAPSPTGPLHAGSLVAALASWLDARAHGGRWLVRIEDVDAPRCLPGADREILCQLERAGLTWDGEVVWQSRRAALYERALEQLGPWTYRCSCSRKTIGKGPYPGTCRGSTEGRAVRFHTGDDQVVVWHDRAHGQLSQNVSREVGDFVVRRADGLWAYQLAVVVDDADQGVTHVVRGLDLLDNTPRQILLQEKLGLPRPAYLHTPLVLAADGQKLSKQTGALAVDLSDPVAALQAAGRTLGLEVTGTEPEGWLRLATEAWAVRCLGTDCLLS